MNTVLAQIDAALDGNDVSTAASIAERAYVAGNRAPLVVNLTAWRYEEDDRLEEAEALLRQGLQQSAFDPTLHVALGTVLRKRGSLREAVTAFERAISLDANYGTAWFERGSTFEKGGALADAANDYRHALQLDPADANAHAALASTSARLGELDVARDHAARAMQLSPGHPLATTALAQIANEERRYDDTIALLEPVAATLDDRKENSISTLSLLADAYEGVERFDDAYAAYARSQGNFQALHGRRLDVDRTGAIQFVDGVAQSLAAADPAQWTGAAVPSASAPRDAKHVFLTGYPRSGTTLVENILASAPNSVAIEERPTLAEFDRTFLNEPDGLARLSALSEGEIEQLRERYWQRATEAAGTDLASKVFVDMDPFKGVRLPVIAKLFPKAKVVLMRRDPRDVVWSCFHTSFAFNAGTLAFSTLESTALHYAATWRVIDAALNTLPIDYLNLSYARLVRDFDATTRELCAFLEIPWTEDLRKFDRTAQRRGVSTASAAQVRRGLYDGTGGWRRYERQLATVEPILAPWIERFEALG